MNYTKEQKQSIEKVKNVFSDYLTNCPTMDLVWSDKLGYVLFLGINNAQDNIANAPEIIQDAESLCYNILFEFVCDIIQDSGAFHDIHLSTPLEIIHIKELLHPYMVQLPEYEHLVDRLFTDPYDEE